MKKTLLLLAMAFMFGGCDSNTKLDFGNKPINGTKFSEIKINRLYCIFNVTYQNDFPLYQENGSLYLCKWSERDKDYIFKDIK